MGTQSKLGYYNNINIPVYSFYTTNLSTYQLVNYSYQLPNNSFIISSPIDENSYFDKKTPAILMTDNNSNILPLTYTLEDDNMFTVEPKTNTIKFDKLTNTLSSINEKLNNLQNSHINLGGNNSPETDVKDHTYNVIFINNDFQLTNGLCYNKIIQFNAYNATIMGNSLTINTNYNNNYYGNLICNINNYISYYDLNKNANETIFTYRDGKHYLIIPISYYLPNGYNDVAIYDDSNQPIGHWFGGKGNITGIVTIPSNNKLCFEINSSNNDYISYYTYVGNIYTGQPNDKLYAIMINDEFFIDNYKQSSSTLDFNISIKAPFIFHNNMNYGYIESNSINLHCIFTYTISTPTVTPTVTPSVTPTPTSTVTPIATPQPS